MSVRAYAVEESTPSFTMPGAWRSLSLGRRFAALALALSVVSTLALGYWVSRKIEQTAVAREAGSAAIYMGHFVSPLLQDIEPGEPLSKEHFDELQMVQNSAALRLRVVAMKVWSTEGRILYSSNPGAVGQIYPIDGALVRALNGSIAAEFNEPGAESSAEHAGNEILLEIYIPIREEVSGKVIAVAEFYERADDLHAQLIAAQFQSWFVTGLLLVSIIAAFSTLIQDGSRTIELQRRELTQRITELSEAMAARKELRERIERGARNVIEENERSLRVVGSDLHDGPAQLISLALLRLDNLDTPDNGDDVGKIRDALADAMKDIRAISAGLLLPNFENLDIRECLETTIHQHESNTGTQVSVTFGNLPATCPPYIKICLCRFVQEGLSNAYRHAGGAGQSVSVEADDAGIRARVTDSGPGFCSGSDSGTRLGLVGLRGRLESIRGTFSVTSSAETGTTLAAWLPLGGSS